MDGGTLEPSLKNLEWVRVRGRERHMTVTHYETGDVCQEENEERDGWIERGKWVF